MTQTQVNDCMLSSQLAMMNGGPAAPGGSVTVTRVVEADLMVHTHGGAVSLGTVRANAARIDSRASRGKDGVIVVGGSRRDRYH